MLSFKNIFKQNKCSVIGMIHLKALPGTPKYEGSIEKIVDTACQEAEIYSKLNIDGLIVENMHDVPYIQGKNIQPETTAIMSRICNEIRNITTNIPCGVQVLASANKEALAIAQAANFQFIRAEGFVFSHVADEGLTDACAGSLLRYRRNINAEDILVFCDIKKKHSSHAITNDISISETAKAAEFFLADGVIITGKSTGNPADINELNTVKDSVHIPVLVGSGVTTENISQYFNADAVIVGSYFKNKGKWNEDLDKDRILAFIDKVNELRNKNV